MNLRTIRKRGLALLLAGVMTVGLAPAALATDGTPRRAVCSPNPSSRCRGRPQ